MARGGYFEYSYLKSASNEPTDIVLGLTLVSQYSIPITSRFRINVGVDQSIGLGNNAASFVGFGFALAISPSLGATLVF